MKKKNIIFCLTIYPKNLKIFKSLGLIPVGLGNLRFSNKWFTDKTGKNIKKKNKYYGEYTFHYWLWKNYIHKLKKYNWIGFCTYRRFWTKNNVKNISSIKNLKNEIFLDFSKINKKYDVILTNPIILKKTKISKVVKNYGFLNCLIDPLILLKKQHNLYDHFKIFHGKYFLEKSISLLNQKEQNKFREFLRTHKFNAHNMFCVKNYKILINFYKKIFNWLFKCEKLFGLNSFHGYEVRKLGFLAELYSNFYFKTNYKVYENNYVFYDTNLLKK